MLLCSWDNSHFILNCKCEIMSIVMLSNDAWFYVIMWNNNDSHTWLRWNKRCYLNNHLSFTLMLTYLITLMLTTPSVPYTWSYSTQISSQNSCNFHFLIRFSSQYTFFLLQYISIPTSERYFSLSKTSNQVLWDEGGIWIKFLS